MAFPTPVTYISDSKEVELIRNILSGRRDLFDHLITPHLRPLSRLVKSRLNDHPDAEDIVQQTALKAFTRLQQFRFEASFRTWLIRIGLNEVQLWRRKRALSRIVALDFTALARLPIADQTQSPLVECLKAETTIRLDAALAKLPEKYRVVVLLREFEGLTLAEAAQRLGLTVQAIKTRQFRAREKMATLVAPPGQTRPFLRACR